MFMYSEHLCLRGFVWVSAHVYVFVCVCVCVCGSYWCFVDTVTLLVCMYACVFLVKCCLYACHLSCACLVFLVTNTVS